MSKFKPRIFLLEYLNHVTQLRVSGAGSYTRLRCFHFFSISIHSCFSQFCSLTDTNTLHSTSTLYYMSSHTLVLAPPVGKNGQNNSSNGDYRSKLEHYAVKLKIRIKTWEHENSGADLTWDVIKKEHPDMARRYKKYSKLKKLLKKSDLGEVDLAKLFANWSRNYREEHPTNLSHKSSENTEERGADKGQYTLHPRHHHHHHHHYIDAKRKGSLDFKNAPNGSSTTHQKVKKLHGVPETPTRRTKLRPIYEDRIGLAEGGLSDAKSDNDKQDDDIFVDNDEQTDRIGPTPQLNGRVLGIFDIELKQLKDKNPLEQTPSKVKDQEITIISPCSSKLTNNKAADNTKSLSASMFETPKGEVRTKDVLFKTPQQSLASCRKKLNFSSNIEQTPQYLHHETETLSMLDYDGMLSDLSDFEDSSSDFESSSDDRTSGSPDIGDDDVIVGGGNTIDDDHNDHILKPVSTSKNDDFIPVLPPTPNVRKLVEPSPLIKRHYEKSLFTMNQELKSIKKNLEFFADQEELKPPVSESEGSLHDEKSGENAKPQKEHDPIASYRKKIKTIKRTTRRSKLKTKGPNDVADELQGVDIHKKLRELEENTRKRRMAALDMANGESNSVDVNDSDSQKEEEVYVRKMIRDPPNKKRRGINPLSNNFVRLKINNHRRGRFRGRR